MANSEVAPVLESLNLLLPVVSCCGERRVFNYIFIPAADEEGFFDGWGHGCEDASTDTCPNCEDFGFLEDPFKFFFLDCEEFNNAIFALRMNLRLIETLARLIQEYKEERLKGDKVHLAMDEPLNCLCDFGVFRLGQEGDDFADHDWSFDRRPFLETNKAVILNKKGIRFSCDISTHGKNRKHLGVATTRLFSAEDLSRINGWLVARGCEDPSVVKPRVADDYEDGLCPDCQRKIPKNAKHGYSCADCGHIFNAVVEDDS